MSALDNFKAALESHIDRYLAMDTAGFLQAMLDLCQQYPDAAPDATIADILPRLVAQGSIEAAAAMIVMEPKGPRREKKMLKALGRIVACSKDLQDDLQVAALTDMLEEWADGEVAAGRMTFAIDPKTGRKLYSTVASKDGSL